MDSVSDARFPSVEDSLKGRIPYNKWKCNEPKDYDYIKKVGEGTFGVVYKAKNKKDQKIVALKLVKLSEDYGFPVPALREILIMKGLNHKNILKLEEILCTSPSEKNNNRGNVYLVFPYMEHDFSGLRMSGKMFNLGQIKYIMHEILEGIAYLHKCKIIHRDIKSSNILINSKGEIKIGDYGLARRDSKVDNKRYTFKVVTICYRAPELLLGCRDYGPEIDIWSIGCVFCELLTGVILFKENCEEKDQINKIFGICGTPDEKSWPGVTKLPFWEKYVQKIGYKNCLRENFKDNELVDDITFDLIQKLLQLNPKERITAEKALDHEFFKVEPKMCKLENLPTDNELHEFQTDKERKENRNRLTDLKNNNNNNIKEMEIGNKDFVGKKRNDSTSKDVTPPRSDKKKKTND